MPFYKTILTLAGALLYVSGNSQTVTYYKDVAPIVEAKCATCHRPGESAPFSLLTYKDVAKRATFIRDVVKSRFMPPWKADPHYVLYSNDRSLSKNEIETIVKWVDANAPAGKDTKKMNPGVYYASSYPRKPDLVLKYGNNITIKGDNTERFVVYKIPFELDSDLNVEGIEFFCTNKKLIHHANYSIHPVEDPSVDLYNTIDHLSLTDDDRTKYQAYLPYKKQIAYYSGWIPGASYEQYPKNMGWTMPKRGVILLTVHYSPLTRDDTTSLGVNLFFTKDPILRKVKVISFGSGGIGEQEITPSFYIEKDTIQKFKLTLMNPREDMSILYVWPHMHYIGKEFLSYALTPLYDTIKLVHIPRWDFRWQEIYRFKKLVKIPRGSRLIIEGTYDNTANNPFNPYHPPRPISSTGDMRSTDEMMTLIMVYMTYNEGDESLNIEN